MFNDVATIYNIVNGKGYRTVIENVHFEANTGVAIEDTGMKESDNALCLIPLQSIKKSGKTFINYKAFEKLSDEEKAKYITFKNGDKIVLGNLDFEITNEKPNTIADLERNNVDVFTITNFSLRRLAGSNINHFEITGK